MFENKREQHVKTAVSTCFMTELTNFDLMVMGRSAAERVAGPDAVEQVEVSSGEDVSERPAYYFSFLIEESRLRQRSGLLRIRLLQTLRDELVANGDGHHPIIQILDRNDWARRADAKPV